MACAISLGDRAHHWQVSIKVAGMKDEIAVAKLGLATFESRMSARTSSALAPGFWLRQAVC
jgi:hypothetical protein